MNLVLFTVAVTIALIFERAVHAFSFSLLYVACRLSPSEKSRAVLSMQVSTSALNSVFSIFASMVSIVLQTVSILLQWVFTVFVMLILSILMYVLLQYATDIMFEAGMAYNRTLGPSFQVLLVWPLRVSAWIFEFLIPLWNAFVWFWKKVPPQILVETVTYNLGVVLNAVESFGSMVMALAMSLMGWIQSFVCCKDGNLDGCNPRCFEAGERVFDILTPMSHLRNFIVWFMQWLREMCFVVSGPFDLITYPFMDINFAKGVHFIGNSIIYFIFHVPAITVERCNQFKSEGAIMCVPDLEPVFNMMTSGFKYIGLFMDNWLDVLLLIVEGTLGRPTPECRTVPDLLRSFDFRSNTFGTNETSIVGMTDYMFARTDGWSVQYFSLDRDWQTVVHPGAFPFDVNLNYGVAAISHFADADHDPKGDDTTSLLGCKCALTSKGIQFTCGVAMFTDTVAASDRTIPIEFQLPSTGQLLHCNKVMVRVESIRWPVSRFTATRVQRTDGSYAQDVGCASKGTCLMADAAIWIRPMCSVDGIDPVCVESFKQASCFPYCMALHVRGSGTQTLILYDAGDWNGGVTLLKRDCGLYNMQAGINASGTMVALPNSQYGLSATAPENNPCVQNPMTVSRITRTRLPEYGAHASMILDKQPFLFANDLALTAVQGQAGLNGLPTWSIKVQRIYGNQANEFTMIPLNQNIPSLGPCITPSNCDNVAAQCRSASGCKAAIPYGYDHSANSHVLGTTSQRYLFWVTNPSLEPFMAFSQYCKNRNNTYTNQLQISVISSYGGIRLWRMDPYIYCPEIDGVRTCPEQQSVLTKMVESLDFEEFDERLCDEKFNVMAVDLDYVTEDNLALTVLRTTLANINIYTLRPIDLSQAEYVTLWVNPSTMELKNDTMWMPEASSPALAQGVLCPGQRRMPNLGSLLAEAVNSVVHFIKMPVNLLLSFPIVLQMAGGKCPLMNRGHSALKSCGSELLSLEDFFSSVFRCNTLFWMAFNIIADSFGPGTPQTFINGAAIVAENGNGVAMLPGFSSGISSAGEVDPGKVPEVVANSMSALPVPIQSAKLAFKNPVANAHFYYRMGSRMLMQVIEASQASRSVGNIFWNVISDGAKDYDDIVLQRMRRTCAGFAIVAGFNSPLGRLVSRWCTAWVEMQKGFLTMATVFFVDVPLMDCVCVKSTGSVFSRYVKSNCWANAPDLQKPMVNALITMDHADACPTMVKMTQAHFTEALDPMFSLLEAGARELASVLDYFIHVNYAGDCNNYADNPYVLALIPQPVDYFRVCGKTETCRLRCLSEFQAFEAKNLEVPVTEQVTESVQSLFFNSMDDDTYMPLKPLAMMELHNCTYPCGYVQHVGQYSDRCVLLAGENSASRLEVISFCVPVQIGANVRRGKQSWTVENLVPGALQTGFVFDLNPLNFWESFRLLVMTETELHICHVSCQLLARADEFGAVRLRKFAILGNQVVVDASALDGVGTFTVKQEFYCFRFAAYGMTAITKCESNIWDGSGWPVCLQDMSNGCSKALILPRTSAESVRTCFRSAGKFVDCTTYTTQRDFVYKSSLSSAGLISQSAKVEGDPMVWHVLMTAPPEQVSHWLLVNKVVLDPLGAATGSTGSGIPAQITVNVQRKCSLDNCVGCVDLGLQRLCYAASQCQIARCIGTMVHQRRPLCAIGMNLASVVQNQLSLVEGAWLIVSDTMVSVLDMGPSGNISWPDQAFFGYICSAKDVSATGISIITASINGAVQSVGEIPVVQANQPAISNNAYVLFSMTMAATTNFLNQIALMPLYAMMATQKTFICGANSILAVAGGDMMSMTLGDSSIQELSNKATGKCMSQFHTENMQGGTDNTKSMVEGAVGQLVNTFVSIKLDFLVHPIDATLTWMQGVISGLQDVVQTIDRNRCKLPDMSAKDSFSCACGDAAYQVVPARRQDSWQDQGYWCSTTMTMMNYDGTTKYVWNPYSLAELEEILGQRTSNGKTALEDYMECIATGGTCTTPSTPLFDTQQVSMLAVYQRCLANYQSRQWDIGAHALFNATLRQRIQATMPTPEEFALPSGYGFSNLSHCLLAAQQQGSTNQECLNIWLRLKDVSSLDFFEYEALQGGFTHACQVFSGPAALPGALGEPYRICMEEYEDSGLCKLPHIVWSGRSTNKVPVGMDHATVIADVNQKVQAARNAYASIQNDVLQALDLMANWTASNLNVMIFSAEGDMLHQFFDCFMMGAMAEAEMWPGSDVTKPMWYRNAEGTREFQLPCAGEALRDRLGKRDSKSPFTCGSYTRRSVIKYFLRNLVQEDPSQNRNIVQQAVQELIVALKRAWGGDLSNFMCQCADGRNSPECCVLDPTCDPANTKCQCEDGSEPSYACCDTECRDSTFLPSRFHVEFAKIRGQNMVQSLFDQAARYLNTTVWMDNRPWLVYDMGGAEAFNWSEQQLQPPVEDGLFDTTKPIKAYDHTELGYPYKTTVWEMCHGLLQQVQFTLPLANGVPTTISSPYDPDMQSNTLNITYREEFVKKLVQEAYKKSSLFWHYIPRHKPSASAMCQKPLPQRWTSSNNTFFVQGYNALKIGGYDLDCYCGWWYNNTHCQMPAEVCERLVLLIGSTDIQRACSNGRIADQSYLSKWMPALIELEGGWRGWPCPSMHISDHWGIMPDQTAWIKGSTDTSQIMNLILVNGTSGLRVGSLDWVKYNIIDHINPSERRESVQPLTCDITPSRNLVEHFIDDLFPAAQGVRHSAAVSSCLRFSIELARLSAFQEAGLVVAAAEQSSIVGTWRKRCEMKLRQVSFCQVYGVFGIQKAEASCPFVVDVAFAGQYTLTPNCLVVYKDKVYDPCLCRSEMCTSTNTRFGLYDLPESCAIMHVRDMVVDRTTKVPPWPSISDTPVPRPLARSSFYNKVLVASGNVANNLDHWASAEGESFHYCDLVVDWWPDDWKHPVGYHVTLPCSDAAHRAFDASWAALRVGQAVKMMHVPTALRNKTLQTNMFGAAGACRTHNYGMPMKVINTMRFCTQADNRAVDPTVPGSMASSPDWGLEYCTQSPFEVPWANGPSSVGTHFNYLVDLLPFAGWRENSGQAPFKACDTDANCCVGCKCLKSKDGGVCAKLQSGTFDCAQHHHCPTELMCAGDGKCVQPVLEIHNNASFDIVNRIFTDKCRHVAVDPWGTSKEEVVPDLLENSGMCSYRSWFEQRNLKNCTAAQCSLDGNHPWMFTSPGQTPRAAFEAEVLGVKAHACDRDYEHYEDLVSCSPGSANSLLRNPLGQVKSYSQGTFTQTYRPNKLLPIIKHPWDNMALGFLGIPKNYNELGYGSMTAVSTGPLLKPCSNFGLCADQASAGLWYVNGRNEQGRLVTLSTGAIRPYTVADTMSCGSMGFEEAGVCRLDPAVVPLFYLYCKVNSALVCSTYNGGVYSKATSASQLQTIATNLNGLFATMQTSVSTWAQYLTAVSTASTIWSDIGSQAWSTTFTAAKVNHRYQGAAPRGLYYLFTYSAYEVPFAWWWRCSWLNGVPVSANPSSCDAWDGLSWSRAEGGISYNPEVTTMREVDAKKWLAQLNGIFTPEQIQSARNQIHQDFISKVNGLSVPPVSFACYNEANYIRNFSDPNYDAVVLETVQSGAPWPATQAFAQCKGFEQCLDHTAFAVDATKNIVEDAKAILKTQTACQASCKCTSNLMNQMCAFAQDSPALLSPLSSMNMAKDRISFPVFATSPGSASTIGSKYDARATGCETVHCCASNYRCTGAGRLDNSQCRCFRDVPTEMEIQSANLNPTPAVKPWLILSDSTTAPVVDGPNYLQSGSGYVAIDLCRPSGKAGRCTFGDPAAQDDCTPLLDNRAKQVQDTYCPPSPLFERQDSDEEICSSRLEGEQNMCMGGHSLNSKYVIKPTGLNMDITAYSIPGIDCWRLSCPLDGPFSANDNAVTYNPDGLTGKGTFSVETVLTELEIYAGAMEFVSGSRCLFCNDYWKYDGLFISSLIQTSVVAYADYDYSTSAKLLSFSSPWCHPTMCFLNYRRTRSLSLMLASTDESGYTLHDTSTYPFFTQEKVLNLVAKTVNATEDTFHRRNLEVCLKSAVSPEDIHLCKNGIYSMTSSDSCDEVTAYNNFLEKIPFICNLMKKTNVYMNTFCPNKYKSFKFCSDTSEDNDLRIPAKELCPKMFRENWQSWSQQLKFKCTRAVYTASLSDTCTRTKQSCPYTSKDEDTMKKAGLPITGFCPDCVGDCALSKSSKTYSMMKANTLIHNIVPTKLLGSRPRTPTNTQHLSFTMKSVSEDIGPPSCNEAACGTNFYKVEIYKGMSVCLPCKVVPPKHCSGSHMCRFLKWNWPEAPVQTFSLFTNSSNAFTDTYNAVRANLIAMLPSAVNLRPVWHEFLDPYNFTSYNPQGLKSGYNDNMESIQGNCKVNNKLPVFTNCQNDLPRTNLKSFAFATYKVPDGNYIPTNHTLSFFTSKSQLLGTNIATWHAALRQAYFSELFNDTICKSGTIANLICFQNTQVTPPETITVNPVLSGRFEVQEGCDVLETDSSRVIDSVCNGITCPPNDNAAYDRYNTFGGADFTTLANQMRCKIRNGATASYLSTPKTYPTNLCSRRPTLPRTCDIRQGTLGHKTYDGSPVSSVYSRGRWPSAFAPSGLLSGNNVLLNGNAAGANTLSNITLDPWDIGGHYVRMRLYESLLVTGLPLGSYSTLSDAAALSAVNWLGEWRSRLTVESGTMNYLMKTCQSWDCPLRRRYFWSGAGADFRPTVPDPMRSKVLYGTPTHPTTRPSPLPSNMVAAYKTRNGFCACLASDTCLPASGPCSASETISSLSDMQYRPASVTQADCVHQIDWPYAGGTLRDGSTLPQTVSNCGILNRLPAFNYRYHNSKQILPSTQTTLDDGGDCHMGRAATYSASAQSCTLVEKKADYVIVNCGASNMTLARPKSVNVDVQRRRPCAQCDPLPTFHASDGTALPEPEVSYGKLWRWAPSRKLAQDLRFRLCGNATSCPQLKSQALQLESFWYNMMAGGLTGTPTNTVEQLFNTVEPDTDDWSAEPWMLCTNSEQGSVCHGAASKADWIKDRSKTCSMIKDMPNANEAVADLTVCDLDESLDNLCRVVQNARYRLFETNCQLSGSCRTSSFFYQPATFSISNDQLARQTVQYFYEFTVPGSCPAMNAELQAILDQNRRTAQDCSAQSLEVFQMAIAAARQVVHFFVKIVYYMTEIWMNIISLVMTPDPNPTIKMVMANFNQLLNEFRQFFVTIGDTMYKMIMETGQLGKFLRDLVMAICAFLKTLIDSVIQPMSCFIKEFVVNLIDIIRSLANTLTFGTADLKAMEGWKATVETQFKCEFENPFHCESLFPDDDRGPTRLPLPTRCWVGYKPPVGDQKGLGCSPSDTCMDDDGTLVACASCSGGGVDMNRYGCDALTKLCRCHTFPVGQSQCSSHQECLLPDVECGFVDAYLQPSFGNVPCSRCSNKPICLVSGSVGQCACTLRSTALQTCPAQYHAQRVSPDPTQLCLISLGISASSSSSYSANYRDLASTPCGNLNGAQTWCLNVWLDMGGSAYLTVGLAMLQGRRLLAVPQLTNSSHWNLAHEPCRSLMEARSLSVLETLVASDCERWRQIGERAIMLYNLTNASDVQFTSYTGMAEANLKLEVYLYLMQYAEWLQPVMVVLRRSLHLMRPLFNKTARLIHSLETMPSTEESVFMVQDIMPWFAAKPRNHTSGRRLLFTQTGTQYNAFPQSTNWKANLQAVKEYSVVWANGDYANLAPSLANEWNRGPFLWPPNYDYWERQHVCLVASITFNLTYPVLRSTVDFYTKSGTKRPAVDPTFYGALPYFATWEGAPPKNEPVLVSSFKELARSWTGIDFSAVKSYTTSPDGGKSPSPFSEDLVDLIRCDFEKVQHCSAHRRSLFWGGVVVALFFAIVSFFLKLLNVPMVDPLLFMAYLPTVMLYVFRFSILCFPMLPTCLMGELVLMVETVFPVSMTWPAELQHWPGCIEGAPPPAYAAAVQPGTSQCFRECTEWPFDFQTWEDSVAWLQCEAGYCDSSAVRNYYQPWAATLPIPNPFYDILQMRRYVDAIERKRVYLDMPAHRDAQRVCFFFTVFNVVPVALAIVGVVAVVLAAGALAVAVAKNVVAVALALVAFVHSN